MKYMEIFYMNWPQFYIVDGSLYGHSEVIQFGWFPVIKLRDPPVLYSDA